MGKSVDIAMVTEQVVADAVAAGETFTAYNVTQAVRNIVGKGTDVPHSAVRGAVHALMMGFIRGGEYASQIESFPDGNALVYFPTAQGRPLQSVGIVSVLVTKKKAEKKPKRKTGDLKMLPVASSAISHLGYDVEKEVLRVQFHGGRLYDYPDVNAKLFAEFVTADSVGKFYNKYVKPLTHEKKGK